jgi:GDP-fucose transporter C1
MFGDLDFLGRSIQLARGIQFSSRSLMPSLGAGLLPAAAVTFYVTVSITLILVNRVILSRDSKEGDIALFSAWFQTGITLILIVLAIDFSRLTRTPTLFSVPTVSWPVFWKVLPASIFFVLNIFLNNKCLQHAPVTAYQVIRSVATPFSIILSRVLLQHTTTPPSFFACCGLMFGLVIGVEGDLVVSARGIVYGVVSGFVTSTYFVSIKKSITALGNDEWLLMEWNSVVSLAIMTPFLWWSGGVAVITQGRSARFWVRQVTSGIFGFAINIATFLNIKVTSPLTHQVAGIMKGSLQALLAYLLFGDAEGMSPLKAVGIVTVLVFSFLYALSRQGGNGNKANKRETEPFKFRNWRIGHVVVTLCYGGLFMWKARPRVANWGSVVTTLLGVHQKGRATGLQAA